MVECLWSQASLGLILRKVCDFRRGDILGSINPHIDFEMDKE